MNPFATLEFTPSLVRLLREKPQRLLQVASNHRKWLLGEVHPDLGSLGDVDRAQQYTAALEELKNHETRAHAIEEFLAPSESLGEVHASEVRILHAQLQRLTEERAAFDRKVGGLRDQLGETQEQFQSALIGWMEYSLISPEQIVVRRGESESAVSLNGSMLVTTNVRASYSHIFVIGENRRVLYTRETLSMTVEGYTKQSREFKPNEKNTRQLFLFGTYLGHERGLDSLVNLPRATKFQLAKLAFEVRPYIQIGKPVVVLDRRPNGTKYLWIYGTLREVKEGRIEPSEKKYKWSPVVAGKAQQK